MGPGQERREPAAADRHGKGRAGPQKNRDWLVRWCRG